jgi:hypothetical protein
MYLNGNTEPLNYMGNTHGGIIEIDGGWYIFYHRQTNLHQFSRQACAERIAFEDDGSIKQIEVTSCGLNGGPLRGIGIYPAYIACNLRSKDGAFEYSHREKAEAGSHPYFTQDEPDHSPDEPEIFGQYIANIRDGALIGFKYFDFTGYRPESVALMLRGTAKGRVRVTTAIGGEPVAIIPLDLNREAAWGWETDAPIKASGGKTALFFTFEGEGKLDLLRIELL